MNSQGNATPLLPVSVGLAIRHQRKTARLGLRETAKKAGISAAHLSMVERDLRTPSTVVISRIADVIAESYR